MRTALLLLVLAVAGAAAGWKLYQFELDRRSRQPLQVEAPTVLEVTRGMRLGDLVQALAARGWTSDGWWVRRYAIHEGLDKRLQTGEFRILPGDSARSLLDRIVRGEVIRRRFTIVEGWTVPQMLSALRAATLQHSPGLAENNLAARLGITHPNPEGWFLPDTYDYVRSDKDVDVLARALGAMRATLEQAWHSRPADLPYADVYAALIVASLVEKETGINTDRPLIASVFVRRLRSGMKLQTDPAVIYGLGRHFDGNLTRKHLVTPTPYNTYVIPGLPPTPIALPGRESINAALAPPETDYLYFVGRGDGTSQFSATLAEHNRAVNRYQRGGNG